MPTLLRFSRFPSILLAVSSAGALFSVAIEPAQAQAPTFDFAARIENNESNDYSSPVRRPNATRPEAPVSAERSQTARSQAAEIWASFLFGTPDRPVATPKFAFARRPETSTPERVRPLPDSPQTVQTAQTSQPADSSRSSRLSQPVPTTDEEIAAARRRRLRELDAILAARRPEEYSRRSARAADAVESPEPLDSFEAPTPLRLIADSSTTETAPRRAAFSRERAEFVRENVETPFDAARANRPKIRQASALEPAPLELADDGFAAFLLPTRPNALRLSPRVFLSTDLVRLPGAASLVEEAPEETAESSESSQTAETPQTAESPRPLESKKPEPVAAPIPQAVPLAEAPVEPAPTTGVPTLRPIAKFVEPRFLPTRR